VRIAVSGGSGFLGRALTGRLAADGHDVAVLTRSGAPAVAGTRSVAWAPDGTTGAWAAEIDGVEAVVNLAGEPIAARRWSAAQKTEILESRVRATRSLAAAIARASRPPSVFISGSAVGYYGARGDEIVTEGTPPGDDFLARVCVQWEHEATRAATTRTRVVCVRTGLVLERDGGALPRMLLPFRFGAGGPVGNGRQYWPWIHRTDWIDLVRWAIESSTLSGPLNATAPNPATNADFAAALGRALRRPAFMPAPAIALRLMLGEMADALLLTGQRAVPARAEATGFTFKYALLDDALAAIFGNTGA
jgi:uncharacterized protein (TIGR01777 family)